MATRGSIGKIALDALIRPATIPLVTPEVGTKISRGLFKSLLKQLGTNKNYYRNTDNPTIGDDILARRFSPNYGKQTEQRFSAIENLLKKKNVDPDQFISESVSTGRINGMKLSSKERNELAERLAISRMYKEGPEFTKYRYGSNLDPIDVPSEGRYIGGYPSEEAYNKVNTLGYNRAGSWIGRDEKQFEKENEFLLKMHNRLKEQYELERESMLPLTSNSGLYYTMDAIRKALGYKNEFNGRRYGYANRYYNDDIREPIQDKIITNQLISRYNITDPKQAESLLSLRPEWQGTEEELVALVRMLNP
jgi:hypothetical protein